MPSGGARVRSGPAKEQDAIRRDRPGDDATWRELPARRPGRTPPWPLPEHSARELALWRILWRRPEAVVWEEDGAELEVAHHVRTLVRAEGPNADSALITQARIQRDALGYSHDARRAKGWRIAGEIVTTNGDRRTSPARPASSKADILKLVRPG